MPLSRAKTQKSLQSTDACPSHCPSEELCLFSSKGQSTCPRNAINVLGHARIHEREETSTGDSCVTHPLPKIMAGTWRMGESSEGIRNFISTGGHCAPRFSCHPSRLHWSGTVPLEVLVQALHPPCDAAGASPPLLEGPLGRTHGNARHMRMARQWGCDVARI